MERASRNPYRGTARLAKQFRARGQGPNILTTIIGTGKEVISTVRGPLSAALRGSLGPVP